MPRPKEPDIEALALQFADAVIGLTRAFYCVGAASPDEFRAATVEYVRLWADIQERRIAPGTICPSRR